MKKTINIIITTIAIICTSVTLFLVLFANAILKVDSSSNVIISTTDSVSITFDEDPLVLDGTSFDLLEGVTAVDSSGMNITHKVDASVMNLEDEKVIVYSINDPNYSLETFERGLKLENYDGPSIKLKDTGFCCNINKLETYIVEMIDNGNISAEDGFGNDISNNIYIDPSVKITVKGLHKLPIMVKNSYGDFETKEMKINITGKLKTNTVTLSSETITVKKGNTFSPEKYIDKAVDSDGNNIANMIVIDNQADVNLPGRYSVYYYVAGEEDQDPVAILSVVVTD